MAEKMFLYCRPNHTLIKSPEKLPNGAVRYVQLAVSAFQGIEYAIRGTSLQAPTLIESLRVLRKFDAASHDVPALHARYVVLKQSERKLVEQAIAKFDWTRFATDNNMDVWLLWTEFLECVDSESEVYAKTWIEYDPMNPPAAFVQWKAEHEKRLAEYNKAVADAEARKLAEAEAEAEAEAAKGKQEGVAVEAVDPVPVTEQAVSIEVVDTATDATEPAQEQAE